MINKLLISLTITTLISALFGLLIPSNFWVVFSLAFIIQVLFFYFYNNHYENTLIEKATRLKLEEFKEASKHISVVQCPCDEKVKQEIIMRFDDDVIYECAKCNKNIKAFAEVRTVLTTEPIYFNKTNE